MTPEQTEQSPWPKFEDDVDSNGLIRIDEDAYNYADIRIQACAGIEDESLWILADCGRTLQMYISELEQERNNALSTLTRLRATISAYGGHGNPGCPDRAEAYLAMVEADALLAKSITPTDSPDSGESHHPV